MDCLKEDKTIRDGFLQILISALTDTLLLTGGDHGLAQYLTNTDTRQKGDLELAVAHY